MPARVTWLSLALAAVYVVIHLPMLGRSMWLLAGLLYALVLGQ